jgi:hypothetical protein
VNENLKMSAARFGLVFILLDKPHEYWIKESQITSYQ